MTWNPLEFTPWNLRVLTPRNCLHILSHLFRIFHCKKWSGAICVIIILSACHVQNLAVFFFLYLYFPPLKIWVLILLISFHTFHSVSVLKSEGYIKMKPWHLFLPVLSLRVLLNSVVMGICTLNTSILLTVSKAASESICSLDLSKRMDAKENCLHVPRVSYSPNQSNIYCMETVKEN